VAQPARPVLLMEKRTARVHSSLPFTNPGPACSNTSLRKLQFAFMFYFVRHDPTPCFEFSTTPSLDVYQPGRDLRGASGVRSDGLRCKSELASYCSRPDPASFLHLDRRFIRENTTPPLFFEVYSRHSFGGLPQMPETIPSRSQYQQCDRHGTSGVHSRPLHS
jgi:hypothetical protein